MKFFKHFSKRTKLVALGAVLALTAFAVVPAVTKAVSGPDRPTKVYQDGATTGFDYVTFNSFTNVPGIGDERQFFDGKYADTGSVFSDPMPQVKQGDILTLNVYVHNNAKASLNDAPGNPGIAQNTKVRVALPTGTAKTQQATAYISADNAQPKEVYDTLDFGAANGGFFGLEYVAGSAHLKGNYVDAPLSDNVVTTGAPIGTLAADGKLKGCFKEMVYVTLKVKVNMPNYVLTKEVRTNPTTETPGTYAKSKDVKAGDIVRWKLMFQNLGTTNLQNVAIADHIPAGLTVDPDSIVLANGSKMPEALVDNGRTISMNIRDYTPGANMFIYYNTKVEKPADTVCSAQALTNTAYATPQGYGAVFDKASVTVPGNECQPPVKPTPVYSCDLLTLTKGSGRTITANVAYTGTNGATLKTVTYNFGDGSTPLTTDKTSTNYTFKTDGTYNVRATLTFDVNNVVKTDVTSAACAKPVTFTTPTTPVTPPTTPTTPPTELPSTGAGSVIGIFAAVFVASTVGYRMFLSRKLAR